jgi:hypothetical protein
MQPRSCRSSLWPPASAKAMKRRPAPSIPSLRPLISSSPAVSRRMLGGLTRVERPALQGQPTKFDHSPRLRGRRLPSITGYHRAAKKINDRSWHQCRRKDHSWTSSRFRLATKMQESYGTRRRSATQPAPTSSRKCFFRTCYVTKSKICLPALSRT